MAMIIHELKQSKATFIIWTLVIVLMNVSIILLFPQFGSEMNDIDSMFANMGGFSAAFGMQEISIATPLGFYGIEGGSILTIGGGMLMAILGGSMISKEGTLHTSEFLFTMPMRRNVILIKKLIAILIMCVTFYLLCGLGAWVGFLIIGEKVEVGCFVIYHLATFLSGLEIMLITFGISAFLKKTSLGLSIGFALLLYFMELLQNISDKAGWLKYITPFYYSDASIVMKDGSIEWMYVLLGFIYAVITVILGFKYFSKRELA